MKIRLDGGQFGWDYILTHIDTGSTRLIQTDWDYPGVASSFGWSHGHGETDGTIECPVCHKSASEMITEAAEYLDDHIGDEIDDPGYFES